MWYLPAKVIYFVVYVAIEIKLHSYCCRGGSRIFFRRGCTRLLLYFNTNKPHSFFLQNTSCIRKLQVILGGRGGAHPLHPPPRSAPVLYCVCDIYLPAHSPMLLATYLTHLPYSTTSAVMQVYLKSVLESFLHPQPSVRMASLHVVNLILRQGLVHPVQVGKNSSF